MAVAGGDYSPPPKLKTMCGCTDRTHADARQAIRDHRLLSIAETMRFSSGARRTAARAAGRRSTTT